MLTVTVPASLFDLTTIEAVKLELGIVDNEKDELLRQMVKQASDAIADFCDGRVFAKQTYQETLPGYGGTYLMVSRTPVVSVSSVLYQNSPVVDYTIEDAGAGLLFRKVGWWWTATVGWLLERIIVPKGEAPDYTVTYVAGYDLPGVANPTLPASVEKACIETVKAWYFVRDRDITIAQIQVGDLGIRYQPNALSWYDKGLPPSAVKLLSSWSGLRQ